MTGSSQELDLLMSLHPSGLHRFILVSCLDLLPKLITSDQTPCLVCRILDHTTCHFVACCRCYFLSGTNIMDEI